ncbi:MAG: efflux RND transporter periplasmic adaptor subunit [Cytophagales bacterium]|nr:efflux RND transporter periplasmic adaptor subunit [Cytophagales bacterium]
MKKQNFIPLMSLIFILSSCGDGSDQQAEEIVRPIRYTEVMMTGGIQQKTFTGVSASGSQTNLSFRTNALITKINVKVGDRVRKGQLLGQLDTKDTDLSYGQTKATVESAKIQMETSLSNLERTKELYQSGSASLNDYEQAKNSYAGANSSYQTAQKSLDLIRSQYDYAKIVAPIDGIISEVIAEVNEFGQAGVPVIVMDAGDGDMEINVGVPEIYISKIKNGEQVEVMINETTVQGTITEVGFSSSGSAVFPVIVQLNNSNADLRPGMPASATFTFGSKDGEQYLVVPMKSVGEDAEGNFVYVIENADNEIGTVKKQHIIIGQLTREGFIVASGLSEGQKIATAGLQTILDGQKVKL